jgi:hypothetical protein
LFQPEAPSNDDYAAAENMAKIEPLGVEETAEGTLYPMPRGKMSELMWKLKQMRCERVGIKCF